MQMNANDWEDIVQRMVAEFNQQPTKAGKHRVLAEWRSKLEWEPPLLQPYKIDEIVREVRLRLETKSDQR